MPVRIGKRFPLSQVASAAVAGAKIAGRSHAQRPSLPCADCRLGGRIHSLGSRRRPRGGRPAPYGRFRNSRRRRGRLALGDARSAARVDGPNSQGFLRHADRRSFHSLLLYDSVLRPALDFRPPPRHIRADRPIPCRHCSIVRRPTAYCRASSRLIAHFHLRGRILAMAALSIFTSMLPTESISATTDAILSWYVPFFALIYIARDNDDVVFILKIICVCALFNTAAGILEFRLEHQFFIDIFPRGMLDTLVENPTPIWKSFYLTLATTEMVYFGPRRLSSLHFPLESLRLFLSLLVYFLLCTERIYLRGHSVGRS